MENNRLRVLPMLSEADRRDYIIEERIQYLENIRKENKLEKLENRLFGVSLTLLGICVSIIAGKTLYGNEKSEEYRLPEELRVYDFDGDGKLNGIEIELMLRDYIPK